MIILHRITKEVIFESEHKTLRETVECAVRQKVSLRRANLWEADLWEADLQEVNLQEANLQGANLQRANLWGTVLCDANLHDAQITYRGRTVKVKFEEAGK